MKKTIVLAAMAAVSFACWLANARSNAETERSSVPASPFKGRVAVISLKSDIESGAILQDPIIRRLGQAEFLVGTGIGTGERDDWQKDHTVWVSIDDIAELVEFADAEEAMKDQAEARGIAPAQRGDQNPRD